METKLIDLPTPRTFDYARALPNLIFAAKPVKKFEITRTGRSIDRSRSERKRG